MSASARLVRTIGRRSGRAAYAALLLLAPAFAPLEGLAAQSDPRLVAAVRLAQEGLSDSARAVTARILAATQPTDSLYPEVLYTVGLLAATERDRRLALRRILADHPQSVWADDALLQLAQLDYAGGNPAATVLQIERLLRDYPNSPLTPAAALWGARAASDRRDPATACRMADLGLAAAGSDLELRNQLAFQRQRCQSLSARVMESVRSAAEDSAARARADSAARSRGGRPARGWYVQVSAVASQAAAAAESARIRRAGYSAVVVREAGYLKIRVGAFATRAEAQAALARIRTRLSGTPFLVRVP